MEGDLNMVRGGGPYGGVDLQGSMRFSHRPAQQQQQLQQHNDPRQGPVLHPAIHDVFPPLSMGTMHECERTVSLADYNKNERARNMAASDEDEPSFMEDAGNVHNEVGGKGAKGFWQRVKWTDQMVKLLITAVSYIGEDASSGCGSWGRLKYALLQKKGKWKSISKVMAERGFFVSPQQCEDKFNDLNKRYKRLNDILGRGTSCQVVENPLLLDRMDHLSNKAKEDVRKILSSKHLFYEEMCSYHNGNRLHLPPDPALQKSLHLALESKEHTDSDGHKKSHEDYDEDDHDAESDECDEFEECPTAHGVIHATCGVMAGSAAKRAKHGSGHEEFSFGNAQESSKSVQINPPNVHIDMNQASYSEGSKSAWYQSQMIQSHTHKLEERRTQIQMEMLELEKQRFKWQKFSKKKDRELEKMRLENERMKLENDSMALELKQKEFSLKGE